jgi:hypothetical protein
MMRCRPEVHRCFAETYSFHLQGSSIKLEEFLVGCSLLSSPFGAEDGSSMFFRNVDELLPDYTASYLIRQQSSRREWLQKGDNITYGSFNESVGISEHKNKVKLSL